jgi:hypothetical protein
MYEIQYNADFMEYKMRPIVSDLNSLYSQDIVSNILNSLLFVGIEQGITKYAHLHKIDFAPHFDFQNKIILPEFGIAYRKLLEYYSTEKVDSFCKAIAYYGVKFIKEVEDRRHIFGYSRLYENSENAHLN